MTARLWRIGSTTAAEASPHHVLTCNVLATAAAGVHISSGRPSQRSSSSTTTRLLQCASISSDRHPLLPSGSSGPLRRPALAAAAVAERSSSTYVVDEALAKSLQSNPQLTRMIEDLTSKLTKLVAPNTPVEPPQHKKRPARELRRVRPEAPRDDIDGPLISEAIQAAKKSPPGPPVALSPDQAAEAEETLAKLAPLAQVGATKLSSRSLVKLIGALKAAHRVLPPNVFASEPGARAVLAAALDAAASDEGPLWRAQDVPAWSMALHGSTPLRAHAPPGALQRLLDSALRFFATPAGQRAWVERSDAERGVRGVTISMTLWAFASCSCHTGGARALAPLVAAVTAATEAGAMRSANAMEWCNTVWSLAKMDVPWKEAEPVWRRAYLALGPSIRRGRCSAQDMSMAWWAAARAGFEPGYSQLAATCREEDAMNVLLAATPEAQATVLWALERTRPRLQAFKEGEGWARLEPLRERMGRVMERRLQAANAERQGGKKAAQGVTNQALLTSLLAWSSMGIVQSEVYMEALRRQLRTAPGASPRAAARAPAPEVAEAEAGEEAGGPLPPSGNDGGVAVGAFAGPRSTRLRWGSDTVCVLLAFGQTVPGVARGLEWRLEQLALEGLLPPGALPPEGWGAPAAPALPLLADSGLGAQEDDAQWEGDGDDDDDEGGGSGSYDEEEEDDVEVIDGSAPASSSSSAAASQSPVGPPRSTKADRKRKREEKNFRSAPAWLQLLDPVWAPQASPQELEMLRSAQLVEANQAAVRLATVRGVLHRARELVCALLPVLAPPPADGADGADGAAPPEQQQQPAPRATTLTEPQTLANLLYAWTLLLPSSTAGAAAGGSGEPGEGEEKEEESAAARERRERYLAVGAAAFAACDRLRPGDFGPVGLTQLFTAHLEATERGLLPGLQAPALLQAARAEWVKFTQDGKRSTISRSHNQVVKLLREWGFEVEVEAKAPGGGGEGEGGGGGSALEPMLVDILVTRLPGGAPCGLAVEFDGAPHFLEQPRRAYNGASALRHAQLRRRARGPLLLNYHEWALLQRRRPHDGSSPLKRSVDRRKRALIKHRLGLLLGQEAVAGLPLTGPEPKKPKKPKEASKGSDSGEGNDSGDEGSAPAKAAGAQQEAVAAAAAVTAAAGAAVAVRQRRAGGAQQASGKRAAKEEGAEGPPARGGRDAGGEEREGQREWAGRRESREGALARGRWGEQGGEERRAASPRRGTVKTISDEMKVETGGRAAWGKAGGGERRSSWDQRGSQRGRGRSSGGGGGRGRGEGREGGGWERGEQREGGGWQRAEPREGGGRSWGRGEGREGGGWGRGDEREGGGRSWGRGEGREGGGGSWQRGEEREGGGGWERGEGREGRGGGFGRSAGRGSSSWDRSGGRGGGGAGRGRERSSGPPRPREQGGDE